MKKKKRKQRKHYRNTGDDVTNVENGNRDVELEGYTKRIEQISERLGTSISEGDRRDIKGHIDDIYETTQKGREEMEILDEEFFMDAFDPRSRDTKDIPENRVKTAMDQGYRAYELRYSDLSSKAMKNMSRTNFEPDRVVEDAAKMVNSVRSQMEKNKFTSDDLEEIENFEKILPISDEPKILSNINELTPKEKKLVREDLDKYYQYLSIKIDESRSDPINPWALAASYLIYRTSLYQEKNR